MSENQKENAKRIFDKLTRNGWTALSAYAMLGNIDAESGVYACRLQGDSSTGFTASQDYAAKVESGEIPESTFERDGKGWGLCQWTYWSRKQRLYQIAKKHEGGIASLDAQMEMIFTEMSKEYPSLLSSLENDALSLYSKVSLICTDYERPAVNNITYRYEAALKWQTYLEGTQQTETQTESGDTPSTAFWPPRTICKDMVGSDVAVLQALLVAHGYPAGDIDGIFGVKTNNMLRAYQSHNGLDADGIAGNQTWSKILKI